jgi:hypothetical protein
MVFRPVKKSAPEAGKPAAGEANAKAKPKRFGVESAKTLRMLPAGAIENEDGKFTWTYLPVLWKSQADGKYGLFTTFKGKTEIAEDDPEKYQEQWQVKPHRAEEGVLELWRTKGMRVKDFSPGAFPSKDGMKFLQTSEPMLVCLLRKRVNEEGKQLQGYEGFDAEESCYQMFDFQTKEQRAARKSGGGGGDPLADL